MGKKKKSGKEKKARSGNDMFAIGDFGAVGDMSAIEALTAPDPVMEGMMSPEEAMKVAMEAMKTSGLCALRKQYAKLIVGAISGGAMDIDHNDATVAVDDRDLGPTDFGLMAELDGLGGESDGEEDLHVQSEKLMKKANEFKRAALVAKRAGKTNDAKMHFARYKGILKEHEELQTVIKDLEGGEEGTEEDVARLEREARQAEAKRVAAPVKKASESRSKSRGKEVAPPPEKKAKGSGESPPGGDAPDETMDAISAAQGLIAGIVGDADSGKVETKEEMLKRMEAEALAEALAEADGEGDDDDGVDQDQLEAEINAPRTRRAASRDPTGPSQSQSKVENVVVESEAKDDPALRTVTDDTLVDATMDEVLNLDESRDTGKRRVEPVEVKGSSAKTSEGKPMDAPPKKVEAEPVMFPPTPKDVLELMERRIATFKKAAIASKRGGDKEDAMRLYGIAKDMQSHLEAAKARSCEPIDPERLPAPPVAETKNAANEKQCDIILHALKRQIGVFQAEIDRCLVDKKPTSEHEKTKKQLERDFLRIKRVRQDSTQPMPAFRMENREVLVEHRNANLRKQDLQVEVKMAAELKPSDGKVKEECDSFVSLELPFPSDSPQKAKSSVVKRCADPVYDFVHVFAIERTRSFDRFVMRKGLSVEIFRTKGFLGHSSERIGNCEIKLSPLLLKAEIEGTYDIFGVSRRRPLGTVEVSIRLSSALQKRDMRLQSMKWVVVSDAPKKVKAEAAPAPANGGQSAPVPEKAVHSEAPMEPSTLVKKEPVQTAPSSPDIPKGATAAASEKKEGTPAPAVKKEAVVDDAMTPDFDPSDPNPPDNMVSCEVMDEELSRLGTLLAKAGAMEKAKLEERRAAVQMQMDILVIQMETGAMTVEKYLDIAVRKAAAEKAFAIRMKREGHVQHAGAALHRYKVMTKEVAEARAELAPE